MMRMCGGPETSITVAGVDELVDGLVIGRGRSTTYIVTGVRCQTVGA